MTRPNVVSRWFEIMGQRGHNKTQAVARYNADNDTFYSAQRFHEWANPDSGRRIPLDVLQTLWLDVLPNAIEQTMGQRPNIDQLFEILWSISPASRNSA